MELSNNNNNINNKPNGQGLTLDYRYLVKWCENTFSSINNNSNRTQ
jgi:hypothetical protein